jgi:CheY-like chemotaxis protein
MNGFEFLGALKAQGGFEDIPVVMLTSRTVAKHRDKANALGAKGFIVKPYDDDEFVGLVLKLTGRFSIA